MNPPAIPVPTAPKNDGLALTSMVLGILAFFTCGLTAIPAIICGHIGKARIRRDGGRTSGDGFALAGLICGYLGLLFIIPALAGLTAPMVIRQRKKANLTEAVGNGRSLSLGIIEFASEYQSYPTEKTASEIAANTGTPKITGTSANALLRQLIQAGMVNTEATFHTKGKGTRKPDNIMTGDELLAPGECGFAYIELPYVENEVPRPILIAPVMTDGSFDPDPFDRKAVVVFTDGSVKTLPIDRNTRAALLDGAPLLSPDHPVWQGRAPVLRLPEFR